MYTNSNRHRMLTNEYSIEGDAEMLTNEYTIGDDELKEGEDILFYSGDMVGSGTVFKIVDGNIDGDVIVQTGNGGRGLEYIRRKDILRA